jgi:hypothetical protein
MINETIEREAMMYVYDLNNCASENGFKTDEAWEFSLATDQEKVELEKKYFPTISTKVLPEFLSELFHQVKAKLVHAKYNGERAGQHNVTESGLQYLIAYNPARLRR